MNTLVICDPSGVVNLLTFRSGGGANTRNPRLLSATPPGYWNAIIKRSYRMGYFVLSPKAAETSSVMRAVVFVGGLAMKSE